MLDFHAHFEERFSQLECIFNKLIEIWQEDWSEVQEILQPKSPEEELIEFNQVMAEEEHKVTYKVKHIFPSIMRPLGLSLMDSLVKEPGLIGAVFFYRVSKLAKKRRADLNLENRSSESAGRSDPLSNLIEKQR